jgi:3-oxoacyl-[acyl-carrier protein] reductase
MIETGLGSGGSEDLVQSWRHRAALGVTTSVDDVAGQVIYLCKASTVTGQSIVVDGGIHFH